MKRAAGIALCCIICLAAFAAAAGDIEIRGPLFVPVAYITERGKIMDENHVLIGRIDKEGIVYDVGNKHLGFIEEDLTVLDTHYKTVASVDPSGILTDGSGLAVGSISETRISDAQGQPVIRYEGAQDKRAILAYFFFFSGGFQD